MIKNWNKFIKPNDIVYHLGDFGNLNIINKLNGKIRIIMGNHEHRNNITPEELLKVGFIKVFEHTAVIEANGKLIHMCHEPSKHNPNMFNLFGHVHDLAFIKPYGVNVGVDVNHYRPMSYERMIYYSNLTGSGYTGEFTI
jgi:calcineurin-like phosphoesterase family protein